MKKYSQLEISRWAYDGENERLLIPAELAEEMLEVLKEAHNEIVGLQIIYEGHDGADNPLLQKIKSIIAKVEEV